MEKYQVNVSRNLTVISGRLVDRCVGSGTGRSSPEKAGSIALLGCLGMTLQLCGGATG